MTSTPKKFESLFSLPIPEIVVVTGPYGCGKSTFALNTGADPSRIVIVDFEKSQKSNVAQMGVKAYFDIQEMMAGKKPRPSDLYRKVCEALDALVVGEQDVIILDNASPLEDSIAAYVQENPGEFGKSAAQYKSMSGLMWGDVKSLYSQALTRWVSKAKQIFIIVHLRDKYVNNAVMKDQVTGKPLQEPKGKDTLDQLSSLFVWLEHGPGGVPSARVLKSRIAKTIFVDPDNPVPGVTDFQLAKLNGEPGMVIIPVLPLRLPRCTWTDIRGYMRQPADLNKPAKGEELSKSQMSEDDRLILRSRIADAEVARMQMQQQTNEANAVIDPPRYAQATAPVGEPIEPGTTTIKKPVIPLAPDMLPKNWGELLTNASLIGKTAIAKKMKDDKASIEDTWVVITAGSNIKPIRLPEGVGKES